MTAGEVMALRTRLGMDGPSFGRLVGVDVRSVRRWEAGKAGPTGSAEAVMRGFVEGLARFEQRGGDVEEVVAFLVSAARVGGLSYVLVKLVDGLRDGRRLGDGLRERR